MDQVARQPDAAATPQADEVPGWRIEVKEGPNQGAVVQLEPGQFRIGAELSNDIVVAGAGVAGEQAMLRLDGASAVLQPLAPGLQFGGKELPAGQPVALADGAVIHAGDTVFQLRAPPTRPRWALLSLGGVLAVLLLVGGASLVGLTSPRRSDDPARTQMQVAPLSLASATEAVSVFQARLREAGLAEQIKLTPMAGAVIAEGSLAGADLARWSEQQMWFDGRYKGGLSLVNRVREAAAAERPNLQLRAVSIGPVPYIITASGDRFVEGAVVDGWTVERIEAERVVLVRDGQRVELRL